MSFDAQDTPNNIFQPNVLFMVSSPRMSTKQNIKSDEREKESTAFATFPVNIRFLSGRNAINTRWYVPLCSRLVKGISFTPNVVKMVFHFVPVSPCNSGPSEPTIFQINLPQKRTSFLKVSAELQNI